VPAMALRLLRQRSYERETHSALREWRRRDRRCRAVLLPPLAAEPSRRQRLAADLGDQRRRGSSEAAGGLDAVGHSLRSRTDARRQRSRHRLGAQRSEERRVGKEWRAGWW